MSSTRNAVSSPGVIKFFASIFSQPFRSLPILVWFYFVWCFLVYPDSSILHGNLPDSDDYMYLDQVLDWLKGQGWYDSFQHRLNPPADVLIVFSRLTELPMAALTGLLTPIFGSLKAAIVTAAVIPPVLFAGMLVVLRWSAELYLDKNWTRVTAFIALFASYLLYQFSPGHIDHHGLTALLVLIGFGCATRMIVEPGNMKWAVGAGLALSFALVVGLEVLPPLVLITAWLGLWAIVEGKKSARITMVYGLTLFTCSILFLAMTARPSEWLVLDPLRYSAVYAILTAGAGLCLTAIYLAALTPFVALRYITGFGLALISAGLYFKAFPALITGPYGAMDSELAHIMFTSITEAKSLIATATTFTGIVLYLLWPLMGLASAMWFVRDLRKRQGFWLWGLAAFLITTHLLLGTFYQIRFMVFVQLFCIIPITAALHRGMTWVGKNCKGRAQGLMELGLLLIAAPLPMMIIPAIANNAPFNTGVVLFPVATADFECDMRSLADELNALDIGASGLIMNEMESGPELLFRTPYSVLAAPFHTDVEGNLDAAHFFLASNAEDDAHVRSTLEQRNIGLVTLCRKMAPLYQGIGGDSLAMRLNTGNIPPWLEQVHYPKEKDYLLFRVISS